MSITVGEIVEWLEEWMPPSLALPGDKIGLQIGNKAAKVSCVLTTLDVTEEVVEEAIRLNAQMIVTHHAVLFHPLYGLRDDDVRSALAIKLVRANLHVYVAHTNLDAAPGGVNDHLALKLGLEDVHAFPLQNGESADELGRIGRLETVVSLIDFARTVRDGLGVEKVRYVGRSLQQVSTVAVVGGAGAGYIDRARNAGADCLVTGDLKYHDALEAFSSGFALVDPGHNGSERFIAEVMRDYLQRKATECGRSMQTVASSVCTEPFRFV